MPYVIIWSPRAVQTYIDTLEYLKKNWTAREVNNFIARTDIALSYICKNPLLYPNSKKGDTRKCVLTKQVSLFYQLQGEDIELLYFWDTRQNPGKLNL